MGRGVLVFVLSGLFMSAVAHAQDSGTRYEQYEHALCIAQGGQVVGQTCVFNGTQPAGALLSVKNFCGYPIRVGFLYIPPGSNDYRFDGFWNIPDSPREINLNISSSLQLRIRRGTKYYITAKNLKTGIAMGQEWFVSRPTFSHTIDDSPHYFGLAGYVQNNYGWIALRLC